MTCKPTSLWRLPVIAALALACLSRSAAAEAPPAHCDGTLRDHFDWAAEARRAKDWQKAEGYALLGLSLADEPVWFGKASWTSVRKNRADALGQVVTGAIACHVTKHRTRLAGDRWQAFQADFDRLHEDCLTFRRIHGRVNVQLIIKAPQACADNPPRWSMAVLLDDESVPVRTEEIVSRLGSARSMAVLVWQDGDGAPALPSASDEIRQGEPVLVTPAPATGPLRPIGERPAWLAPTLVGVGAAAVAAAGVGWLYDAKAYDRLQVLREQCLGGECVAGSAGAEALRAGRNYEARRNLSLTLGGLLGALSVTGLIWYLVEPSTPEAESEQAAALCGAQGCLLQISRRF